MSGPPSNIAPKYPPPVHKRLQTRLIAAIGVVVVFVAAIAFFSSMHFVFEETNRDFRSDALSLVDIINEDIIQDNIQDDHPKNTQKTIQRLREYRRVRNVYLLDNEGMVKYASDPRAVGKRFTPKSPNCINCHRQSVTRRRHDIEIHTPDPLKSYLRTMVPINAKPACHRCHAKASDHVGLLVVDVASHTQWHLITTARNYTILFSLIGAIMMVFLISAIVNRTVSRPISFIIEGLHAIGEGDMTRAISIRGDDEIALLTRAFEDMRIHMIDRIREINERDTHISELDAMRQDLQSINRSLNRRVSELTTLNRIGTAVNATLDLEELFRVVAEIAGETLVVESFCLFLKNEETGRLEIKSGIGIAADAPQKVFFYPGEGIAGRVLESGHARIVGDVRNEPEFIFFPELHPEMRSLIVVPLVIHDNVIGVFHISSHFENAFSPYDLAFFSAVANQLAIAVDNARHYQREKERATTDLLTGLCNHGHFQTRLTDEIVRALRYGHMLTLLMLDIDHFKHVNDTWGHPSGDVVLRAIGAILRENTRAIDIVARYGGEEFTVILPETPMESGRAVAERIRKTVGEKQFVIPGNAEPIRITISAGITAYAGESDTKEELIARADQALYHAKEQGRNRVVASTV